MAPLLLALLMAMPSACASSSPPASHGGPVQDQVSLIDALRADGHKVEPKEVVQQPFFSVPGNTLDVDGQTVQVFDYADEAGAAADAAKIQPDGTVPQTMVNWIGTPHFYRAGRVIVLYVGSDAGVLGALMKAAGAPFAEGSGAR